MNRKISPQTEEFAERITLKCRNQKGVAVINGVTLSDALQGIVNVEALTNQVEPSVLVKVIPGNFAGVWSKREIRGYVGILCCEPGGAQELVNLPVRLALRSPKIH